MAGIVADGPAREVNTERARFTERIEHAAEVRAKVAAPLVEQAVADGTAYLAARDRMQEATRVQASAGRLRRRSAARTVAEATAVHREAETITRDRWGRLPQTATGIPEWAEAVAGQQADTDPRVAEARQVAERDRRAGQGLTARQLREETALRRRTIGDARPSSIAARAATLRKQAEQDRRDLAQIEALPLREAAQLVHERAAQAEAARLAAEREKAAAEARAAKLGHFPSTTTTRRTGPERGGLGLSL
ncbi:MAG: hypothetical protein QM635_00440 [Microbacteriaceae bacterium]